MNLYYELQVVRVPAGFKEIRTLRFFTIMITYTRYFMFEINNFFFVTEFGIFLNFTHAYKIYVIFFTKLSYRVYNYRCYLKLRVNTIAMK